MRSSYSFARFRPVMLLAVAIVAGTVLLGNGQKAANGWALERGHHVPCYTCSQNYSDDTAACEKKFPNHDARWQKCLAGAQGQYDHCVLSCTPF